MPIESSLGIPNIALALGVSSWRCAHRQSSNHHAQGTRHCLQWRFLAILDNPKSPPNLKTNFRNSATAYFPTLRFDGSTAAIESPVWTSVALNTVLFGRSFSVAMNEKSIWITGCRPFRLHCLALSAFRPHTVLKQTESIRAVAVHSQRVRGFARKLEHFTLSSSVSCSAFSPALGRSSGTQCVHPTHL